MSSQHDNTQFGFIDHAEELRRRLTYGIIAVIVGMMVAWFLYPTLYQLIAGPINRCVQAHGGVLVTYRPADAFFLRLRVAGIIGVVLGSPVAVWQLWAFIRPALTRRERRVVTPIMPMVCILFLMGAATAYLFLPQVMNFFLAYVPHGVKANIDFTQTVDLPFKLILAFGLAFQLPVILLGLVMLGIITPAALLAKWRIALVVIAVIAAVITPTGDPFNMTLMMIPLIVLYFLTVLLAFRFTKKQSREQQTVERDMANE